MRILVGGPEATKALTRPSQSRPCTSLQCSSCDMKVGCYPGRQWANSVDYLFLRNNYPLTVDGGLEARPGRVAYCCQCSWTTVNAGCGDEQPLKRVLPASKWFCCGHVAT